jgi:hypothetical protein
MIHQKTFRSLSLVALSLLALATVAQAEPVKVHVRDLNVMLSGLSSLDGAEKLVGEKLVRMPYEFAGPTRWAIAYNLTIVRNQVQVQNAAKADIVRAIANGGSRIEPTDTESMARFSAEYQKLIDTEITVELMRIPLDELQLDKNAIPPTVLSALAPMIVP